MWRHRLVDVPRTSLDNGVGFITSKYCSYRCNSTAAMTCSSNFPSRLVETTTPQYSSTYRWPRRWLRERDLDIFKRLTSGLSHAGSKHNQCQQCDGAEEEIRAISRPHQEDWSCEGNKPIRDLFVKWISTEFARVTREEVVMSK
jgi:hypothetical protein